MDAWKNQLFFGDNLEILRSGRIPVGSVDLIYLEYHGRCLRPSRKPPVAAKAPAIKNGRGTCCEFLSRQDAKTQSSKKNAVRGTPYPWRLGVLARDSS